MTDAELKLKLKPKSISTYHKCLGRYGYALKESELTTEQIAKIKKDLTVTPVVLAAYTQIKPKSYRIYYRDKEFYYVPRFWGIEHFGTPDYVALSSGTPMSPEAKCTFDPMPHQVEAFKKLNNIFSPGKQLGDGGVLSLPCGYGKTFCAIKTACQLGLKTLIIVPTECLMDQWAEAIHGFAPGSKVGFIQRDRIETEGRDFVVAMLHSICLKDYPAKIFDQFGLTVYDECHHIGSETFCQSVMKIRTKYILGLSATPNRKDGLSEVFYRFMGPLFHREKRSGSNQIIIKKLSVYSTDEGYNVLYLPGGTKNTSGMVTAISQIEERNQLIVFVLSELCRQGRRILLLSSRKQHLHRIKEMLDEAKIRNPVTGALVTYGFYYGKQGMNRQTHKALLAESAKSDIVLGIDIIAKEGLDIPDRNTLVWSTPPGVEIEQPAGRILRKYHKDINPMIIDIADNTGNFPNHSRERNKWFTEEDYIIHDHTVELLGSPDMWQAPVADYIHKMRMEPMLKRRKAKIETEQEEALVGPDLTQCVLNDLNGLSESEKSKESDLPVKEKAKLKLKLNSSQTKGPNNKLCYLAYAAPKTDSEPEPSNEPNTRVCLI
jgi:superfamily II DNA or RNA helicase